jgi:metallo-beta-lactamase class B
MGDSEKVQYNGWRPIRPHKPDFDAETLCKPTRFFDQMCYIGTRSVCCYLLETSEGLVLVDCMWPREEYARLLKDSIAELGHSLDELKAIVLTHGHEDHYGIADELRRDYGATIYLSAIDNVYGKDPDQIPGLPPLKPLSWDADTLLEDGDILTFGNTSITCVLTPGHTPGCMSFIIDVADCGKVHKVLLWGGTGVMPWTDPDVYMDSVDKFEAICTEQDVDCYVSNHPFVDLAYYKLDIIEHMVDGVNNPFVASPDACHDYLEMFRDRALAAKARSAAGADFKL